METKELKGVVFDITHYMIEDGPGIRTNVFMKGCFLKCPWCSNAYGLRPQIEVAFLTEKCIHCGKCAQAAPEDVDKICPSGAKRQIGRVYTVDQVVREVEKDRMFYRRGDGGVTMSGGEILMQPEFVIQVLKQCQDRFINTAIETSAYGEWEALEQMIHYCDTVFIDCKCMDGKRHKQLTGVDNALILENIQKAAALCKKQGIPLIIRLPLIPGINDDRENLTATAELVKSLKGNVLLNILPYHNYGIHKYDHLGREYQMKDCQPPGRQQLDQVKALMDELGATCSIGGYNIDF